MKVFIIVIYIGMVIVFTCTENLYLFLAEQELHFQFNRYPNLTDFFNNDLSSLHDLTYVMQKLGHFICFFLLTILLLWAFQNWLIVVLVSLGLAFLTEVAQLFFSRSGRLLDVGYDVAGLILFIVLYVCYRFVGWLYGKLFTSEVRRH